MDKDIVDQLLIPVIIPLLSVATAFIIAWLRAKTREMNKKAEEDAVMRNFELLDKIIEEVTGSLDETSSMSLFEKTDFEKIKMEALTQIYTSLGESEILILKKATSDLDCLICSKIESILLSSRADK